MCTGERRKRAEGRGEAGWNRTDAEPPNGAFFHVGALRISDFLTLNTSLCVGGGLGECWRLM